MKHFLNLNDRLINVSVISRRNILDIQELQNNITNQIHNENLGICWLGVDLRSTNILVGVQKDSHDSWIKGGSTIWSVPDETIDQMLTGRIHDEGVQNTISLHARGIHYPSFGRIYWGYHIRSWGYTHCGWHITSTFNRAQD